MSGMADSFFGLLTGFAYLHIGIAGVVGCFLTALISAILWWTRAKFAKGMPGALIVVLVPLLMLGVIPGLELLAVPIGLIAAAMVAALHYRYWKSPEGSGVDATVAVIAGLSLLAIAAAYVLGSLSNVGG